MDRSTYDGGVDECAPTALLLEEGQDEGDDSGAQEDDDKLVLELLEDQLPDRGGRLLSDGCVKYRSASDV